MSDTQLLEDVQLYEREDLLTGCQAVSQAVRLADVDVIAAYPIRPYTEVMDAISKLIADGQLDAEYIIADSEHSQFEIVKHASSVGARAFAGSSGTGWMYGFEALVVTATDRLPVLFLVGNRALDDPGAFGVEHNDALAIRDMGWLLCWATTAQEALEHVLLGYRIAEDRRVRMPMALAMDGAFLTHSQHMVKIPSPEAVRRFLRATVRGFRDTIRNPTTAVEPVLRRDDQAKKDVEIERLRMAIRDNVVTPEVRANGFGAIDPVRMEEAIAQLTLGYTFKARPKADAVFDASFLPPLADRRAN